MRKKALLLQYSRNKTGGGESIAKSLNTFEEKIMSIITLEAVTANLQVPVSDADDIQEVNKNCVLLVIVRQINS